MLLEQNAQYRQNARTSQSNLAMNNSIQAANGMSQTLAGSLHQSVPVGVPAVAVAQVTTRNLVENGLVKHGLFRTLVNIITLSKGVVPFIPRPVGWCRWGWLTIRWWRQRWWQPCPVLSRPTRSRGNKPDPSAETFYKIRWGTMSASYRCSNISPCRIRCVLRPVFKQSPFSPTIRFKFNLALVRGNSNLHLAWWSNR